MFLQAIDAPQLQISSNWRRNSKVPANLLVAPTFVKRRKLICTPDKLQNSLEKLRSSVGFWHRDPLEKDGTMFPHGALRHDNWIGSDVIRILDCLKQQQKAHVLRLVLGANTLFRKWYASQCISYDAYIIIR